MDYERFLQAIRADPQYRGQLAHVERLVARLARYAAPAQPLADDLFPALASNLGKRRLVVRSFSSLHRAGVCAV